MIKNSVGRKGSLRKDNLGSCGIKDLIISICYLLSGKQHKYHCLVLALHLHGMMWDLKSLTAEPVGVKDIMLIIHVYVAQSCKNK